MQARVPALGAARVGHLHHRDDAEHEHRGGKRREQISGHQPAQQARPPDDPVPDEDAGDSARSVEDHDEEEEAEVEWPGRSHAGDRHLEHGDERRADHRSIERADAADEGHEDDDPRGVVAQRLGGDDLVVQRGETAGDAGEEAGEHHHQIPDPLRVVADELDPLGIVTHRVGEAAQRRLRQPVGEEHAADGPDRDEVIHLQRRFVVDSKPALAGDAIAGDAAFAAEECGEHEGARGHHLADAERDHREGRACAPRGDVAEDEPEGERRDAAKEGQQGDGSGQAARAQRIEQVQRGKRAQAVIDRVTER